MGESRAPIDNASPSSDGSIELSRRPDFIKKKPGPSFLLADAFDPLKHNELLNFWHEVDYHFQPINQDHLSFLKSLSSNFHNGLYDRDLRLSLPSDADIKTSDHRDRKRDGKREAKRERPGEDGGKRPADRTVSVKVKGENTIAGLRSTSSVNSEILKSAYTEADPPLMRSSLNSFPYTQRLIAALLDENPNGVPMQVNSINRSSLGASGDNFWMGAGSEAEVRAYQSALETRVKHELIEKGWIEENQDEPLDTELRKEQWKLRDLKTANGIRNAAIFSNVCVAEVKEQANRREQKRHDDKIEMSYLDRMIDKMKKNKKSRAKYQKLLSRMYGHYKEKEKTNEKTKKASESATNSRGVSNGEEKIRTSGKKKKKNKGKHELPVKSAVKGPTRKSAP